jgi:hypothetical protein
VGKEVQIMTLRRELIQTISKELENHLGDFYLSERIADAILELRAFKTDEESPEYEVRGSDEWKERVGDELAEQSIDAAIYSGKPVKQKAVNKQTEIFELETLIDEQLTRLGMNWREEKPTDQDSFRTFLKKHKKDGKTLDKWVNWWMSDEWRVANPPWNLGAIRKQWNKAFVKAENALEIKEDDNEIPMSYG